MMPVRDVGLHAAEQLLESQDRALGRHAPEPVRDAAVVGVDGDRRRRHRLLRERPEAALGIREHQEDRAEVRLRGVQDLPAVFLRGRARVLVRQDDPALGVLGTEARQQAEAAQRAVAVRERLLEHVEGGRLVLLQDALGEPARVALPRLFVARVARRAVQDHAHDVVGIAVVELVLVGRRDDVVGGR
jgi:hypothetical protein